MARNRRTPRTLTAALYGPPAPRPPASPELGLAEHKASLVPGPGGGMGVRDQLVSKLGPDGFAALERQLRGSKPKRRRRRAPRARRRAVVVA